MMQSFVSARFGRSLLLWQTLFILLSLSWLWAPWLNPDISPHTSLISQYENPTQPFSVLFRIGDIAGGVLLVLMALQFYHYRQSKIVLGLLACIGLGMLLDPVLPTSCHMVGGECQEYTSYAFYAHAAETIITAMSLFVLMAFDAVVRKRAVSILAVLGQVGYGLLYVTHVADEQRFNTVSQFAYQFLVVIWLAWFCRDYLLQSERLRSTMQSHLARYGAAVWIFLSGISTILLSLTHIHILGNIGRVYLAQGAWLAQYSVIIGVILLYLSRHLLRGEMRARQIVLALLGAEIIKYSVLSPQATVLYLYLLGFTALFVLRDAFDRGTAYVTWQVRLQDLTTLLGGLTGVVLIAAFAISRDPNALHTVGNGFDHFGDFVLRDTFVSRHGTRSALFAHAITAFVSAAAAGVLWILFRPNLGVKPELNNPADVERTLLDHATSSEDYFKLWPGDKAYFWSNDHSGFIAYKRAGAVAFVLADPIGPQTEQQLTSFQDYCKANRLKICCLPVYEQSLPLYIRQKYEVLHIGASAIIDIAVFSQKTARSKWWRWQRNRAEKAGYTYHVSQPPHSPRLIQACRLVSDAWLAEGGHTERGFSLGYFDEAYLGKCTLHYLTDTSGTVIAFVNELPQFRQQSTITIDLLRYQPKMNGTMPYLLYATVLAIAENKPEFTQFDLGFVPFATTSGPLMRIAKTLGGKRFSAAGLEQFKNKFDPVWQPNYLAYQGDLADLASIASQLERVMKVHP